jgi:hypothetical protein
MSGGERNKKREYEMTKYIRDKPWSNNEQRLRRETLLPTIEENVDFSGM